MLFRRRGWRVVVGKLYDMMWNERGSAEGTVEGFSSPGRTTARRCYWCRHDHDTERRRGKKSQTVTLPSTQRWYAFSQSPRDQQVKDPSKLLLDIATIWKNGIEVRCSGRPRRISHFKRWRRCEKCPCTIIGVAARVLVPEHSKAQATPDIKTGSL